MSTNAIAKSAASNEPPKRFGISYLTGFGLAMQGTSRFERFGWLAVGILVPMVGPIAIEGYRFDALEAFLRGRAKSFPRIETNRFGEYLSRGIWVFLPAMLAQFVITPVIVGFTQLTSVGIMLVASAVVGSGSVTQEEVIGFASIAFAAIFGLVTAFALLIKMLLTPVQLRAGLTQDIAKTFDIGWVRDFLGRVWFELLMAELFFFVVGTGLAWIGLLFCFVGAFFTVALGILAHTHLTGQLYRLYLVRGGSPVEFKTPSSLAETNWSEANQ